MSESISTIADLLFELLLYLGQHLVFLKVVRFEICEKKKNCASPRPSERVTLSHQLEILCSKRTRQCEQSARRPGQLISKKEPGGVTFWRQRPRNFGDKTQFFSPHTTLLC